MHGGARWPNLRLRRALHCFFTGGHAKLAHGSIQLLAAAVHRVHRGTRAFLLWVSGPLREDIAPAPSHFDLTPAAMLGGGPGPGVPPVPATPEGNGENLGVGQWTMSSW